MRTKLNWLFALVLACFCFAFFHPQVSDAQAPTPQSQAFAVYPKYMVLGVVYAPPGSSSSVTYGASQAVGSQNSVSSTASSSTTITASQTVGGGLFGFNLKTTTAESDGWNTTTGTGSSFGVETTNGNSISTLGPISSSLGVNHDNDVIYILLNPMLTDSVALKSGSTTINTLTWKGLYSNSCAMSDVNDQPSIYAQVNGCDPNQYPYPDIVGIPVWCLKNPYYPGQGCAQWLPYTSRSWDNSYRGAAGTGTAAYPANPTNAAGLTLQDYADILKADPFVQLNGNSLNSCHETVGATYGVNMNPNNTETQAAPVANGVVTYVSVTSGGTYTSAPTVIFSSPPPPPPPASSGNVATGLAIMSGGKVIGVEITSGGTGYALPPTVTFTGGGQTSAAAATAFISSVPINCGTPAVGTQITRFQPYGTVEYPVPGPNGLPSTYSGNFNLAANSTNSTTATDSHTVGYSVDISFGFDNTGSDLPNFAASFSAGTSTSNTLTWQNSTINNQTNTYTAAYSITGPQLSDNYTGPATYNVYLDNIYGTYAFYSDLEPTVALGTIGVQATWNNATTSYIPEAAFSGVAVGSSSAPILVTLTNNATTPMTMVWPAVTFNDPGFQLVQNNPSYPDGCSNQYLLPYGQTSGLQTYTCTLYIQFTPQASDLPNPVTFANQVVQATMVAAGTQNASAYQNILVVSETPVYGTATGSQGATLLANQAVVSSSNGIPNIYFYANTTFSSSGVAQPQTETFTFTNHNSAGVTLATPAGQTSPVTFTDRNADYTIVPGTNTCVAGPLPSNTCSFQVQFLPVGTYSATTAVGTGIAVNGYVNPAVGSPTPAIIQLANSGAVGQVAGGTLTISPSSPIYLSATINPNCTGVGNLFCPSGSFGQVLTIANGTTSPITLPTSQTVVNSSTNNDANFVIDMNSNGSDIYPIAGSTYSDNTGQGGNGPLIANCPTPPTTLLPGASCSAVVYLYVQDGSPGTTSGSNYSSSFTIAGTEGSQTLSVSGSITVDLTNQSPQFILAPIALGQGQTVTAGKMAQYGLQLSPGNGGNYPGAVSFSVSGLPTGATATFSPATLAANAGAQNVVLSVQTAAASASAVQPGSVGGQGPGPWLAFALMPMAAVWRMRRSRAALARVLSMALLMVAGFAAVTGLSGCGGTVGSPLPHPAQSYTLTVTATSGPSVESITVPLTIQ